MSRQRRKVIKANVPVADLRARLSLSISEAMRLTGYGRVRIETLIESDEVRWFTEGAGGYKRIETASLVEYQNRRISNRKAS